VPVLQLTLSLGGGHPAGWRHPRAASPASPVEVLTEAARLAEDAGFDLVALADALSTEESGFPFALESFSLAAFLAARTSRIGLAATADPRFHAPYTLARLSASLDHIAHGRSAMAVARLDDEATAANHGGGLAHGTEPERAEEALDVVTKLWDSWEDEAFVRDKATGRFVDGTRIHEVRHEGRFHRVHGPLNVARPPQGWPVLQAADGEHDELRDLAVGGPDGDGSAERRLLPTIPILGDTREAARDAYRELNALIELDEPDGRGPARTLAGVVRPGGRNAAALSAVAGVDLTRHPLDRSLGRRVLDALAPEGQAIVERARGRTGLDDGSLTLRDIVCDFVVGPAAFVGTPEEFVADARTRLAAPGAVGLDVHPPVLTESLERFAAQVLPMLRDAAPPAGATLRDRLGLARPANRWAPQEAAA